MVHSWDSLPLYGIEVYKRLVSQMAILVVDSLISRDRLVKRIDLALPFETSEDARLVGIPIAGRLLPRNLPQLLCSWLPGSARDKAEGGIALGLKNLSKNLGPPSLYDINIAYRLVVS